MDSKTKIKLSAILLIPVALMAVVNLVILQGGFFTEKISVLPKRVKPAALEKNLDVSDLDLSVKNFSIKTKSLWGRFRRGESIEISCSIENASEKTVKNFHSVIRTPQKELAQMQTKTLKPGEKLNLQGSFIPENSGAVIVACRGDSEKTVVEANENNNREIAVLYIQ
ncbi:hypothetical protein HYW83_04875 [Candidatus Peregrinibacteria bacterium]|nr:hypothetical protein [Candidatus Peregrinibacteria bacterium]